MSEHACLYCGAAHLLASQETSVGNHSDIHSWMEGMSRCRGQLQYRERNNTSCFKMLNNIKF